MLLPGKEVFRENLYHDLALLVSTGTTFKNFMNKHYITTPLYYVNAKPHIGHAYTNVLCDTFARYFRLLDGKESVFFLTGTDEHGTKIQKCAVAANQSPRDYVDSIVPLFKDLWVKLGIEYDYFIRTTDESHKRIVAQILRTLEAKGDIYKESYKGWYSVQDESFYTETQLREGLPEEIQNTLQEIEEENYFFRMSKYQDELMRYIEAHPEWIQPEMRRNEILGFLKNHTLEDLCITRPRKRLEWGIDYPTSPDHVVYVWFDALINYVSAIGYGEDMKKFSTWWPAVHVIGKDILRQHAVFWPIMLMAMGAAMPQKILSHGWWRMGGSKMSKSLGNVVDPLEMISKYGSDAFRYFLLREVTLGSDGSFSEELLRERYSSDLANDLGNLWHRYASMLEKYFAGQVPDGDINWKIPVLTRALQLQSAVSEFMSSYNPKDALIQIFEVTTLANQFVEERKPWSLAKDPAKKGELAETLSVLTETLVRVGILLQGFLPQTSAQILTRLGTCAHLKDLSVSTRLVLAGKKIERGEPLFPRLEDETPKV